MGAGTRVISVIKRVTKGPNKSGNFVYGTVLSVNPVSVSIDAKLTITQEFIEMSPFCYATYIDLSHTHQATATQGSVSVQEALTNPYMLWRGLKVGDKVKMIELNGGQFYYVLERVGGILAA